MLTFLQERAAKAADSLAKIAPTPGVAEDATASLYIPSGVVLDATKPPLIAQEERERKLDKSQVLESLPGVGTTTATRLLERFGSIEAISQADEITLCEVSGIGPASAKKILDVLRR